MRGFGSLYYTDCRPGQGILGVAGFQFQAATPGTAPGAMALVQRAVLYEPPAGWMRDRRAVEDYPRSLAHTAADDLFVTAAGRYLGKEANGPREGNQFTHAVVTGDAGAYGLVRPAQLWDADWWARGPAPGTELAAMPDGPQPGPLDPETVRDRVGAGGQDLLTALLSAIEHRADPRRRRMVVLVATDPGEAACWIAAATLLLPGPQALRTSFKIFTVDAQHGGHDIVGLHPDWAGRWADMSPGSGVSVFDLDRGLHSTVEPTPAAVFWVPRFLNSDRYDVYDVIDAVELSGQFARSRPDASNIAEPTDADRLAAAVVAGNESLRTSAETDAMAAWLLDAPAEAVDIAGEDVLAAVLAARPPAEVLRTLAEATGWRGWVRQTASIRRSLLPIEVREALGTTECVAGLRAVSGRRALRSVDRPDEDVETGRAVVEDALRTAGPHQVPALLAVARRHGLHPVTNNVRDVMYGFAAWWLVQTAPALALGRWPAPPEAIDWVRDVLRGWLRTQPAAAVDAIGQRWWRPLRADATDPRDPLDATVLRAAYHGSPDDERGQVLHEVQQLAWTCLPRSPGAADLAWDVLFGSRVPTTAETELFLTGWLGLDRPISAHVLSNVVAVLEREPGPSEVGLRLLGTLKERRFPLPARLADAAERDDEVRRVVRALLAKPAPRGGAELAVALDAADLTMLETQARDLVDALLGAPIALGTGTLWACSPRTVRPIYRELESRWPRPERPHSRDQVRAAAFAFALFTSVPRDEEQGLHFEQLLRRLSDVVGPADKEVRTAIGRLVPANAAQRWERWLAEIGPGRMARARNFVAKAVPGMASEPTSRKRGE